METTTGTGTMVISSTPTYGTPINKPVDYGNFVSIMFLLSIIWFNVAPKDGVQRIAAASSIVIWMIDSIFKLFIFF